jgi:hypothetical protein
MSGIDEYLEIVPGGRSLIETVAGTFPHVQFPYLVDMGCLEEGVSHGRPDVYDDISESSCGDLLHVVVNGYRVVGVIREIGTGVDPDEPRFQAYGIDYRGVIARSVRYDGIHHSAGIPPFPRRNIGFAIAGCRKRQGNAPREESYY